MSGKIIEAEGILGNFEARRRIEEETAESKPVGRVRPRMRETTPGSAAWSEIHTAERLVDEEG
ncbi:hypothetical protein [Desulfomicrobium escambiense]|uniref:hypothetical protein n=1 Tax=Desulfomicrobium escambiense TaxID=29503 RepID=UPI0003FAE707|nr:hypothetical protein [Desulfomicrobium escambiense]